MQRRRLFLPAASGVILQLGSQRSERADSERSRFRFPPGRQRIEKILDGSAHRGGNNLASAKSRNDRWHDAPIVTPFQATP
jgi:hypothetical protein